MCDIKVMKLLYQMYIMRYTKYAGKYGEEVKRGGILVYIYK